MSTTTPFQQALAQVEAKQLNTPSVSIGTKPIDYFSYQLAVHLFNLKVMSRGMKFRGITFTDIKTYYGLKGRSAKDCLPQMEAIVNDYKTKYQSN